MTMKSKPFNRKGYDNFDKIFKKKRPKGKKSYKWINGKVVEIPTNNKPTLRELI